MQDYKNRQNALNNTPEDLLARQSDVTVSSNVTLYSEYRGFFVYVISAIALITWACWSFIPESVLSDYFGITYLPDRYWSVAIPTYILVLMLYLYIALALYNTEKKTVKLDDAKNFVDEYSVLAGSSRASGIVDASRYVFESTSGVQDLPVPLVNEVLYGSDDDLDLNSN